MGYTYGPKAAAMLISEHLVAAVRGQPITAIPAAWDAMHHSLRNAGQSGIGMMAIAAVDMPTWPTLG